MLEQMAWGLGVCDILKVSDDELALFTGENDLVSAAEILLGRYPGIRLMSVTAGPAGSHCWCGGNHVFVPAFRMEGTCDTTGAGDTYGGCVLSYVLEHGIEGMTPGAMKEMMTFANAAAALVTTRKGALRVMPSAEEIMDLIRTVG